MLRLAASSGGHRPASSSTASAALRTPMRFWSKPKRRPKVGVGFHEKAQRWRSEHLLDQHRRLADSLRAYVDFSATKRAEPWDTRFRPFDRIDKDGAHLLARHLMADKLALCNNHHRAAKRLFCNVGLLGPQVTTLARWKPARFAALPASATKADRVFAKDATLLNAGLND